jgi:hypothetical protein
LSKQFVGEDHFRQPPGLEVLLQRRHHPALRCARVP